jgi:RNA polymerase sigma factor (sigma-70 family)
MLTATSSAVVPDRAARIESVMRLATAISRQYRPCPQMSREDWEQQATLSAIEAVDTFDPGYRLTLGQWVGVRINWDLRDILTRLCKRSIRIEHNDPNHLAEREPGDEAQFDDLWDAIDQLPRKDRAILIGAYGLDRIKPVPFAELARRRKKSSASIYLSRRRSLGQLRLTLGAAG